MTDVARRPDNLVMIMRSAWLTMIEDRLETIRPLMTGPSLRMFSDVPILRDGIGGHLATRSDIAEVDGDLSGIIGFKDHLLRHADGGKECQEGRECMQLLWGAHGDGSWSCCRVWIDVVTRDGVVFDRAVKIEVQRDHSIKGVLDRTGVTPADIWHRLEEFVIDLAADNPEQFPEAVRIRDQLAADTRNILGIYN